MKSLQSGSNTEKDENGKRYGQATLGQWLLVDVLALNSRTLVTREWLEKKELIVFGFGVKKMIIR